MVKRLLIVMVLILLNSTAYANPDAIVVRNGDIRLKGAGSGLVFPDGSIQYRAAESVTLLTICNAIKTGGKSLPDFCPNATPIANAGASQTAALNVMVTLNGGASSDTDGDVLTYRWTFASKPVGSAAVLTNGNSMIPTFIPDVNGNYVLNLIVNDGKVDSALSTVTIFASSPSSDPLIPTGMTDSDLTTGLLTGGSSAWVNISFTDSIARNSGFGYYEYSIRYELNGVYGNTIVKSGNKEPQYLFSPVIVGADYYVKVRAVSEIGVFSAWSNEVHIIAAVDIDEPDPPIVNKLTGGVGVISLYWTPPADIDVNHYAIYRNDTTNPLTATKVASFVTGAFWFDTSVLNCVTYTYWLKSVDGSGNESVFSNSKSAAPVAISGC